MNFVFQKSFVISIVSIYVLVSPAYSQVSKNATNTTQSIEEELNEFESEEFPDETDEEALEAELENESLEDQGQQADQQASEEDQAIDAELQQAQKKTEEEVKSPDAQVTQNPTEKTDQQKNTQQITEDEFLGETDPQEQQLTDEDTLTVEPAVETSETPVNQDPPVIFEYAESAPEVDMKLINPSGEVIYEYATDPMVPYRDRKKSWSSLFKLDVESFVPDQYRSQIDTNSYDVLFGTKPIPVASLHLGTKKNFSFVSIGLEGFAGYGEVGERLFMKDSQADPNEYETLRVLKVIRYGLSGSIILDDITANPYVAPYGSFQVFQTQVSESKSNSLGSSEKKKTTGYATGFSLGALIQLNWLNPQSAFEAYRNYGLENSYIDIFMSTRNTSSGVDDPSLQASASYGAGIRLEY